MPGGAFQRYKGLKPDSVEGRYVAEMKDAMDQLQALFTEGLVDASENFATNGQKNTAPEGGNTVKKNSLRDKEIPTREQLERKAPIKVIDISRPQTKGTFAERRKQILSNAKEIIKKPYLNRDTNTVIFLTEKSYTHIFSNPGELQINAAEHLPEFVENAVLTSADKPTHGSDYAEGVYTFFAAARTDLAFPVKLTVKEYKYSGQPLPQNIAAYFDKNPQTYASSYDTVVLEVQKIEESPNGSVESTAKMATRLNPSELSTIKIADLLDLVKGNAAKYIPAATYGGKKQSARDPMRAEAVQVLEQENEKLREDVGRLKELVKLQRSLTHGTKFTRSSVEAVARYLKGLTHAKGDTNRHVESQALLLDRGPVVRPPYKYR